MSTDLETDLRHEFDAARPPSNLTFSPESVMHTGKRTVRRRTIIATGTAAMTVALVAGGATLLTRPHDSAAPQPATRTATTGIILAQSGHEWGGQSEVRFNRRPPSHPSRTRTRSRPSPGPTLMARTAGSP